MDLEVGVVDVLEDEGGGAGDGVLDDVQEGDDVRASAEVLQDLDLPLDLLLFHRLQMDTLRSRLATRGHKSKMRWRAMTRKKGTKIAYLENFDDALLVRVDLDALEDLAVLAPAQLAEELIVIDVPSKPSLAMRWDAVGRSARELCTPTR